MEDIILRNREAIEKIAKRKEFRNRNGSFYAREIKSFCFDYAQFVSADDSYSGNPEIWWKTNNKGISAAASLGKLPTEFYESLKASGTAGDKIYIVFSYNTPIGWARDNQELTIPDVTYSITTTKHQGFTRQGDYAFKRIKENVHN